MKTTAISKTMQTLGICLFLMVAVLTSNKAQAQASAEHEVKGIVTGPEGALEDVTIVLKGTTIGTSTDKKGAFTFPKLVSPGDILSFSYLGFQTKEVKIKEDTTFIEVTLTEEYVEFVGAPNSNQPYKSKRNTAKKK